RAAQGAGDEAARPEVGAITRHSMGFVARGGAFWFRVAPEHRDVASGRASVTIQRMVRLRSRYSINPRPADRARALRVTYDFWRDRPRPRYVAMAFEHDTPVFHCPGLVFTSENLVPAGTLEQQGRRLQFIR